MNEETTQGMGDTVDMAVKAAEATVRRPGIRRLARFGFYAKGLLFVVIGASACCSLPVIVKAKSPILPGRLRRSPISRLGRSYLLSLSSARLATAFGTSSGQWRMSTTPAAIGLEY